jgi:hypothetical protein
MAKTVSYSNTDVDHTLREGATTAAEAAAALAGIF